MKPIFLRSRYPSACRALCPSLLLAAALLISSQQLGGCSADAPAPSISQSPPAPLIGGVLDTEDLAVVALTSGSSFPFCTGTLISPRVILTAAHCVDMLGAEPNAAIVFGSDSGDGMVRITVAQKKQHPLWTGDLSGGHDIGLLLMDSPYEDPSIAKEINVTSPAVDHIGDGYRHVGFGVFDRSTGQSDGRKRQGTTTISGTQGDVILSGDSTLSVCFGDSGGPGFLSINDREVIAGVHSFTSGQECTPPNGDTDVQKYAEDFILPWIRDNDASCGLDGVCGPIGCSDDPDCLPCGPNGTCVSDCPIPDLDCQTQGLGDICKARSQCITDQCIAFRGDPDYHFCSEPCNPGDGTCASGMSCQSINPFGNLCYWDRAPPGVLGDECGEAADCGSYSCREGVCVVPCNLRLGQGCPENFECASHDGEESYYCFERPVQEGGCRSAQGRGPGSWWLILLALAGMKSLRSKRSEATFPP